MYTVLAIGVFLCAALALTLVPYRFPAPCARWFLYLRRKVFSGCSQVVIRPEKSQADTSLFWLRMWGAVSAAVLMATGIEHVAASANQPQTVTQAGVLTAISLAAAAAGVLGAVAVLSYFPRARAHATLQRQGIGGLWVLSGSRHPPRLHEGLETRAHSSTSLRVLDVTGYDLVGKGPGSAGGLLYDTLAAMSGVPARILLVDPGGHAADPEQKHATVFQTILAEMQMTPASYRRRLRATLDAVENLNEKRAPEAKIEVRYTAEKPSLRLVLLDQVAFVAPWNPREEGVPLPLLEIEKTSGGPSLYEGFRRQFARLWKSSTQRERGEDGRSAARAAQEARQAHAVLTGQAPQAAPRPGSSVVRRRDAEAVAT